MKRLGLLFAFFALLCLQSAWAQLAGGLQFPGPGTVHSAGGGGSVTVDAKSATVTTCTTSPCTVNLTLGGTATGVAIMLNGTPAAPPTALAVTWNSVSMTAIPNTASGTNGGCSCWTEAFGLVSPATGAHSFSISWTGGAIELHAVGISFIGNTTASVAAAFPNGTQTVHDTSTASPITTTVTSATNHIVPAFVCQQVSAFGTINGTLIATDAATGPSCAVSGNYNSGAATVTPSFAFTGSSVTSIVAFDVSP
jgi:hypothetical protein